jgi:hypothetical protein
LVNAVRDLAKHFTEKAGTMKATVKDFESLFPAVEAQKESLLDFTGAVSESNYIDRAIDFLATKDTFIAALQAIEKVEKFIRNSLPKVNEWKNFVQAVSDELNKASKTNDVIGRLKQDFNNQLSKDVVSNFAALQQTTQKIKDEYHHLFSEAVVLLSQKYSQLKSDAELLIAEINGLPAGLNTAALSEANGLLQYATQRTQATIALEFDVKDKQSRFTYSEVLSFIDLHSSKKTKIDIIQASLVRVVPPVVTPPTDGGTIVKDPVMPKTFISTFPGKKMKVLIYKNWLKQELQKLASVSDDDEIELN